MAQPPTYALQRIAKDAKKGGQHYATPKQNEAKAHVAAPLVHADGGDISRFGVRSGIVWRR
jgi:hypothetical protein